MPEKYNKIVILGHSNSILSDGWASHLKSMHSNAVYLNLSIGGSPSPALLYQAVLYAHEISSADLVIVEPTVVDHGEDWQTGDGVAGQADALLSWLRKCTEANIILLILPRTAAWLLRPSQGMQAWAAIGQRHAVTVIDGRTALIQYCRVNGVNLDNAWRDNMGHTVSDAQQKIANLVYSCISHPYLNSPNYTNDSNSHFRVLTANEVAKNNFLTLVNHETSLMSISCVRVTGGKAIRINGKSAERMHGMAINFGGFDPTNMISLSVIAKDGRKTAVTVGNPFLGYGPSGRLTLMFAPARVDHDVDSVELMEECRARFLDFSNEQFEVSGFLFGPEIKADDRWRYQGVPLVEIVE